MRIFALLIVSLSTLTALHANADDVLLNKSPPSELAESMPGAEGTFAFQPKDWMPGELTWWQDTDGVDPGTAGCHIGTDSDGKPNGRKFGEACLAAGLLVESNPGLGVLHSHAYDVGTPDLFDCNAWCIGNGAIAGKGIAASAPLCEASARCACDQELAEAGEQSCLL